MDSLDIADESNHELGSARLRATKACRVRSAIATSDKHSHYWTGRLSPLRSDRGRFKCLRQRHNDLVDNGDFRRFRPAGAADFG